MHRLTYVLLIVGSAALAQNSYAICKVCNASYVMQKWLNPRMFDYINTQKNLVTRDVSYLPEDDYVEEHESRQGDTQSLDRDNRNLMPEYRSLCEILTKKVRLDDTEYEYQPPHYHEVYCKHYSLLDSIERTADTGKQKCVHPGFHCVQRSRTLFLVRRRWDSDCWEPITKEIASGCDCMWPVSILGDIAAHY